MPDWQLKGKLTVGQDRSIQEEIDLDSGSDKEETKTPSLPVTSSEESLDEADNNKEEQENETEERSELEIVAETPLT